MAVWIKNTTGATTTYSGRDIFAGTYVEALDTFLYKWQNNSTLLVDIASGDAVVAKDDSGSNDIADVSDAINYLKGDQPIKIDKTEPVHQFPMAESADLRARLVGVFSVDVTKNSTTTHDWLIPAVAYAGVDKQSLMNGIQYYAKDAEAGDYISFQIVDKNEVMAGIYYPATPTLAGIPGVEGLDWTQVLPDGVVLDEFSTNFYVMPDSPQKFVLYKAKLIKDLYVRVNYTSIGVTNDVKFVCNILRHIDTSIDI